MGFAQRLLLALSRDPRSADHRPQSSASGVEDALDHLEAMLPTFLPLVQDRRVLDFGCGQGFQSVAMAERGAASVLGVDTNSAAVAQALELARHRRVDDRVTFTTRLDGAVRGSFDVVLSHNSMEHFSDPAAMLETMSSSLRPGGIVVVTFSPPWLAPYGAHMYFFTRVPWVHLLFSERTVMSVRKRFRSDDAARYQDLKEGLNRMTLAKFERLVTDSGLLVRHRSYRAVKGLPWVDRIPGVRELLVNSVTVVLERPSP